jgi:hypothetical protein
MRLFPRQRSSQAGEPVLARIAMSLAKATPSARSPFIFQLPATSALRGAMLFPRP